MAQAAATGDGIGKADHRARLGARDGARRQASRRSTSRYVIRAPRADQVVALRSPAAERAEIHETKMSDGIMQMRQITDATVPAGGALALEPGGTHVMLIGLRSPLVPGATVPLVLTFRHAGEVQVKAVVLAPGSVPPGQ